MTLPASHDELIETLATDLRPVRRLASPLVRALLWLALVAAIAAALATLADLDALRHRLEAAPDMWLAVLGSSLTAVAAAIAVFELSVPDRNPRWALLPLPPFLLWVGASGLGCLRAWIVAGTHSASLAEATHCLVFIVGFSVPLGGVLFFMLRRAFPLRTGLTAVVGGLAVAAAAATLLNFFHPFDAAATDLAVHALSVAIVVGGSRMIADRTFPT